MALAKKLEGNPKHPISQGKLCVRGQAAIQATYHPDRIRMPLRRSGARGSGPFQEISWDDALSDVVARLDGLASANNQKALGFLRGLSEGNGRFWCPCFFNDSARRPQPLSSYSAKTFFARPTDKALATLSFPHSISPDRVTFSHSGQIFWERGILPLPTVWLTEKCAREGREFVRSSCKSSRECRRRAPMRMSGCPSFPAPKAC